MIRLFSPGAAKRQLHRLLVWMTGMPDEPARPAAAGLAALDRTFTLSLEEYASLLELVDEGMWEIAAAGKVLPSHERVCAIFGMEPYCDEDFVAGDRPKARA